MPPELVAIFSYLWQIVKAWWWVPLPFLLWKPFSYFWLWWRMEEFFKKQKSICLEIKIPEESLKPIRAMESVFAGLHQSFWDPPNFWEKWWDGKVVLGFSLETVSIGGQTHFYIKIPEERRDVVEACIYSQYPEAEITLAEDYTKYVPQDIPNEEWDMWGSDYRLVKPNPYPIKTYLEFEKETAKEEKRIDPVALLLEAMAKIKPGEQFWLQILCSPRAQEAVLPFLKEGEAIRDKLAKRPERPKPKPIIQEALKILITGKRPEEKKEEIWFSPEMVLTPGEREVISGVERKISKSPFACTVRFIFLGKRDVWFKGNLRLAFSFFGNYSTEDLNKIVNLGKTLTKVYSRPPFNILDKRRTYLRKRRMFRLYCDKAPPYYPRSADYRTGVFILNTEELTSLYHFPSRVVAPAPGVPWVEAKKEAAPPELPTE